MEWEKREKREKKKRKRLLRFKILIHQFSGEVLKTLIKVGMQTIPREVFIHVHGMYAESGKEKGKN